jgi:non-homologous end joining protein Ku
MRIPRTKRADSVRRSRADLSVEANLKRRRLSLIEARAAGKPTPGRKVRAAKATNVVDLVSVLQKSLAAARKTPKKRPKARKRRAA